MVGFQRFPYSSQPLLRSISAEKAPFWNPFGRPGAGAPNPSDNQSRTYVRSSIFLRHRFIRFISLAIRFE